MNFLWIVMLGALAQAQVKFAKSHVELDGHKIEVEVADSDAKRMQGLMFRSELPEGKGMLFVFERPQQLFFWMKGTLIPLSIGYFDKNCRLLNTHEMTPPKAGIHDMLLPRYSSEGPAQYALELPAGWFVQRKLKTGTALSSPVLKCNQ